MAKKINYYLEADKAAARHGIPKPIFRALVGAESGWNRFAKSPVGATGFTQLMPKTAAGLGVDPSNPLQNLDGGARYLRMQLDHFGNMREALAAYNAGPGNVESGEWLKFKETTRYVQKIMSATPTQAHAVQTRPNKQQPVTKTAFSGPPPTDLTQPSPLATDPTQVALAGLAKIGQGESPTHTLKSLVDSIAATPTPVRQHVQQPASQTPTPEQPVQAPKQGKPQQLKPGGGWGGSKNIAAGFAQIGFKHGLSSVSEKRSRQNTTSGNVSDHYEGNKEAYAYDLSNGSAPTPEMDAAAIAIAAAAGVKYDGKSPLVLTVRKNGYRIQVLYRTQVGGNHNNHIHVGVEREA